MPTPEEIIERLMAGAHGMDPRLAALLDAPQSPAMPVAPAPAPTSEAWIDPNVARRMAPAPPQVAPPAPIAAAPPPAPPPASPEPSAEAQAPLVDPWARAEKQAQERMRGGVGDYFQRTRGYQPKPAEGWMDDVPEGPVPDMDDDRPPGMGPQRREVDAVGAPPAGEGSDRDPISEALAMDEGPRRSAAYPGAPDLGQAGLSGREQAGKYVSYLGDIGSAIGQAIQRGRMSRMAHLEGRAPPVQVGGGMTERFRQGIDARPEERRRAMLQQYAANRQAEQDQRARSADDPTSEAAQRVQRTFGPLLERAGMPPETITLLTPNNAPTLDAAWRTAAQIRAQQQQAQAAAVREQENTQALEATARGLYPGQAAALPQGAPADASKLIAQQGRAETMAGIQRQAADERAGRAEDLRRDLLAQNQTFQEEQAEARRAEQRQARRERLQEQRASREQRQEQYEEDIERKRGQLDVPGLTATPAVTPDASKKMRGLLAAKSSVQRTINGIISTTPSGAADRFGRTAAGMLPWQTESSALNEQRDSYYGQLAMGLKNFYELGAITESDAGLMNQLKGKDADEIESMLRDMGPAALKTLLRGVQDDYGSTAGAFGFELTKSTPGAARPKQDRESSGQIHVRDPKTGRVKVVPASQRDAAVAAGYEVL